MNEVAISGWVRSAPVISRLGTHAAFTEFGLGLEPPELAYADSAITVICHGRLAPQAFSHLDVGDVVEIRGYLFVTPDLTDSCRERVSIIADELGLPGRTTFHHNTANAKLSTDLNDHDEGRDGGSS